LKAILITIILCATSIIIIYNDTSNVAASESGGEYDFILSSDIIYRITENLSNVIYTAYDDSDLRKGRAFGSKGEHKIAIQYFLSMKKQFQLLLQQRLQYVH